MKKSEYWFEVSAAGLKEKVRSTSEDAALVLGLGRLGLPVTQYAAEAEVRKVGEVRELRCVKCKTNAVKTVGGVCNDCRIKAQHRKYTMPRFPRRDKRG